MSNNYRSIAAIGLGSNLGDKLGEIHRALACLADLPDTEVKGSSRFYRTAPVGVSGQDWFVNGVALIDTALSPVEVLTHLLAIEKKLGRERLNKWDARTIDLDLLFYDQVVLDHPDLTLPHPYLHLRRFVLCPLMDLAPDWVHPRLGQSVTIMSANPDLLDQEVTVL